MELYMSRRDAHHDDNGEKDETRGGSSTCHSSSNHIRVFRRSSNHNRVFALSIDTAYTAFFFCAMEGEIEREREREEGWLPAAIFSS